MSGVAEGGPGETGRPEGRKIRVVVAKPGLDGHDVGGEKREQERNR